jgi:hypothetical protein
MSCSDLNILDQANIVAARVEALLRSRETTVVPEYLTPAEAAILVNMPVKTLEHWRLRGEGPSFARVGVRVRRCPAAP